MKETENRRQIGNATYFVERVFAADKTPRQVLLEEIVSAAAKNDLLTAPPDR